jgi:hypothetical protein
MLVGLAVDMFGAVLTHIHNGDPLNDSTGAISLLVRLLALGILWSLCSRADAPRRTARSAILGVAAIAIACLAIAHIGGSAMRHSGSHVSSVLLP